MWTNGGLTELDNLITLCSTCHRGLDPHQDHSLYQLIKVDPFNFAKYERADYMSRIRAYQEVVRDAYYGSNQKRGANGERKKSARKRT